MPFSSTKPALASGYSSGTRVLEVVRIEELQEYSRGYLQDALETNTSQVIEMILLGEAASVNAGYYNREIWGRIEDCVT
jgi:hypothetical protein